uniref:Purple acid phosphatase n=1 Tax=Aegilops tauschii TaxID=37682 RepID=R7WFB7_AEGTA
MRISWVTDDRKAPSVVEYGKSRGNYTVSTTGDHATYRYFFYKSGAIHHVTIGPLAPSTTYHYRCGKAGDEFTLKTPPASLPIELVVIGDLGQTGWTASTLSHIGGADYDMLLLPGDLSYADTQQPLWDSFGRLVQPLASARPWMVTEGNHEAEALPVVGFAPFVAYNARWRMPHEESGSASNLYYSFDMAGGTAWTGGRRRGCWSCCTRRGTTPTRRTRGRARRCAPPWRRSSTRPASTSSSPDTSTPTSDSIYDNEADSRGPMFITIGDGGNREGLALKFLKDHKSAHLSMFREASFGHGRLRIVNETSAVWTWHRNDDEYATVRDEVWLESLATPKLSMATTGRHDEEL